MALRVGRGRGPAAPQHQDYVGIGPLHEVYLDVDWVPQNFPDWIVCLGVEGSVRCLFCNQEMMPSGTREALPSKLDLTFMAALLVTLSLAQFQLHSQGSGRSDRHWWWEVVHVHDERLHSRARIATLEQQPVSIRLEEGRGIKICKFYSRSPGQRRERLLKMTVPSN